MAIDTEEEVTFLARALANLASATDPFVKELQAATGWPASILMGESPGGLGKEGRFEERVWSSICAKWQETYCKDPITQLFTYFFLSKAGPTGGTPPKSWQVEFPAVFTQTDTELAELQGLHAASDNQWVTMGVLNPLEIRQSRFGGAEYSSEITLDETVTSMLVDQQAAQHESAMISMAAQNEATLNPQAQPAEQAVTDSADPVIYANQGLRIQVSHEVKGAKAGRLVDRLGQRTDSTEDAPYFVLGGYKPGLPIKKAKFIQDGQTISGPYVAGFYTDTTAKKALQLLYPKLPSISLEVVSPDESAKLRANWGCY
jgi:hypothetical protein